MVIQAPQICGLHACAWLGIGPLEPRVEKLITWRMRTSKTNQSYCWCFRNLFRNVWDFFFVARKSLRKREKQIVWFFKKDKSFLFNSKKSPLLNKSRYIQVKNLGVFFIPQFFEGLGIPYVPCEWNIYRSMNGLNLWSWYINVAKHEPVPWSFERYVM